MDCDGALSSRGTAGDWHGQKSALAAKLGQQIQTSLRWWCAITAKCLPFEEWLETVLSIYYRPRKGRCCAEQPGWETAEAEVCVKSAVYWFWTMGDFLSAGQTGQYRAGYEGYGQLFKEMGRCPIRVACCSPAAKSREIVPPEGQEQYEHCYCKLPEAGRELFRDKGISAGYIRMGTISGTINALALKLVAAATQELFDGKIVEVLNYVQQG